MSDSPATPATPAAPATLAAPSAATLADRGERSGRTDVLIVGAGPVGLFAAFQAGVLGLGCHLVDVLDRAGGQCTELYPEKPIYDIPAIPGCNAQELVDRLLEQCAPFGFPMHFGERADSVTDITDADGHARLLVTTDAGRRFDVAAVLICAGAGAFAPQRVSLPEATALEGRHVHYAVRDVARFAGKRVIVAGGGDSALDWALALRKVAARVTLLHRREGFRAADHTVASMRAAVAAGEMDFMVGMLGALRTTDATGATGATEGALTAAQIKTRDGDREVPVDDVIALYGLVSEPGPIAHWDMDMRAGRILVDTTTYESSRRGLFAAGDIAFYANKQKLILSGFHEAALALRKAYHYAFPDKSLVHVHTSNNAALKEKLTHG